MSPNKLSSSPCHGECGSLPAWRLRFSPIKGAMIPPRPLLPDETRRHKRHTSNQQIRIQHKEKTRNNKERTIRKLDKHERRQSSEHHHEVTRRKEKCRQAPCKHMRSLSSNRGTHDPSGLAPARATQQAAGRAASAANKSCKRKGPGKRTTHRQRQNRQRSAARNQRDGPT